MSVSHAYFYSVQIISSFQCSLPAVPDIITQDSERLFIHCAGCRFASFSLHTYRTASALHLCAAARQNTWPGNNYCSFSI